jgi:hypothetical protein
MVSGLKYSIDYTRVKSFVGLALTLRALRDCLATCLRYTCERCAPVLRGLVKLIKWSQGVMKLIAKVSCRTPP